MVGDDALLSSVLGRRTDLTKLEMKAFQMAMPIAYNCHTLCAPSAAECDHAQPLSRLSIAFAFSELGCQSPSTKWIKQAVCLQLAFQDCGTAKRNSQHFPASLQHLSPQRTRTFHRFSMIWPWWTCVVQPRTSNESRTCLFKNQIRWATPNYRSIKPLYTLFHLAYATADAILRSQHGLGGWRCPALWRPWSKNRSDTAGDEGLSDGYANCIQLPHPLCTQCSRVRPCAIAVKTLHSICLFWAWLPIAFNKMDQTSGLFAIGVQDCGTAKRNSQHLPASLQHLSPGNFYSVLPMATTTSIGGFCLVASWEPGFCLLNKLPADVTSVLPPFDRLRNGMQRCRQPTGINNNKTKQCFPFSRQTANSV